jgi:L-alanine-DL-glutamate epimerase-like enolase superfamily enzyme
MPRLTWEPLALPLEFTFTISRSSKTVAQTVLVRLYHTAPDGLAFEGLGEAVPAKVYGEDADSVCAFYENLQSQPWLAELDPFDLQGLHEALDRLPGNRAAKAGLEMAFYDLQGKLLEIPLYRLWGLDPRRAPKTSYTIGLADLETVRRKTETALSRGYDVLKIKLGGTDDVAALRLIRSMTPQATLRADANAAWTLREALEMLPLLADLGIEFLEEPLKLGTPDADHLELKEKSLIPIMADESCHTLQDIPRCATLFHAINLKLTKTGGLWEAQRMIHAAHAHDLKVMLGCFSETSVSISALAHLSPLVDYADLDGSLLLAQDPFDGVRFEGCRMHLPHRPGLGVLPRGQ